MEHFLGKEEVIGSIPIVGFLRKDTGSSGAVLLEMVSKLDGFGTLMLGLGL